jgi:hypothetical protein
MSLRRFAMVLVSVPLTKGNAYADQSRRKPSQEAALEKKENRNAPQEPATLAWRHSVHICALSDGERHVGHIVKIGGRWHAFDAMHSNENGDGFCSLGNYSSEGPAKNSVEECYRLLPAFFAGAA